MPEKRNTKKPKVMIADDDPFIVSLYNSTLTREGFEVVSVADGEETLAGIEAHKPDLLILDLNMPRMDGREVLRYIRAHPEHSDIPVVVLSNACSESDMADVWNLKPTRFMLKRDSKPNLVVEEVKGIFAESHYGKNSKESSKVQTVPAPSAEPQLPEAKVNLKPFLDATSGEERRNALLDAYKSVQVCLQRLQEGDPRTCPAQYGRAMEDLFEDLYAQPQKINPSTCRTLSRAAGELQLALRHADAVKQAISAVCSTLLVLPDNQMREEASQWLDRPGFCLVRVRDLATGLGLAEDNRFDLAIFDAGKAASAEKIKKRLASLGEGRPSCSVFLINPEQFGRLGRDFPGTFTEMATRPPIRSELVLKAIVAYMRGRL